jgi:hypothetical protein
MNKRFLVLMSTSLLATMATATLADDEPDYTNPNTFGVTTSEKAIAGPHATADMMLLQSDWALKNRHYDDAIKYAQNAIVKDPEDADVHIGYAQALEGKLRHQKDKDIHLFMASVREWLLILRSERGEEKGLTNSKGIGLPRMEKLYQDPDRQGLADQHLRALVGYLPKVKETDSKYLKRVEDQAQKMVDAKIITKKDDEKQTDGKSTAANGSSKQEAERPGAHTR